MRKHAIVSHLPHPLLSLRASHVLPLIISLICVVACPAPDEQTTEATTVGPDATSAGPTDGETSTSDTGETSTEGTTTDNTTGPVDECVVTKCKVDRDHDGVSFTCDNSPDAYNPDQSDMDGDGYGDIDDLCPTIVDQTNTADSDRDGIGNACDVCRRSVQTYNMSDDIPDYLRVRNNPSQLDSDRDGIGDACDNCVRVPNCQGYGDSNGLTPHKVGAPLDDEADDCQPDADFNGIGDACEGVMAPGAAGPVGFGPDDDFDQDGLANAQDGCPRLVVDMQPCQGDTDCPPSASCAPSGQCGHADTDQDGIGDICDTCLTDPNPQQVAEGGSEEDDEDGDFIGKLCEQNSECEIRRNPRAHAYYDVHSNGRCCATLYDIYNGAGVFDPFGQPVDVLALGPYPPGVTELPPGCDEVAQPVTVDDVGSLAEMRPFLCMLAAPDQDFDHVPDSCDLCTHAFDPLQEIYIDENDKEWPDLGKYCQGEYGPDSLDPNNNCWASP